MKVTLLHNPYAGDADQPSGDEILSLIRSAGHSAVYQSSKEPGWEKALEEAADIVAVAGGDGTVGKVAKRLIGNHTPIAVLPLGTANNIATALNLTDPPIEHLIAGWATARRMKYDVGIASGPWGSTSFIEGLGVGLFVDTMSRLNAKSNFPIAHLDDTSEKIMSVLEIIRSRLEKYPANWLNVTLDGQDLSGEYVLLEAMNIRCVGPNLCLAPDADPGDGLLDIVVASKHEQDQIDRYLSDRIEGKSTSPGLTVRKGRHVRIEFKEVPVHIDDDLWPDEGWPLPASTTIEIKLDCECLQMLIPA